jgi:hypothetical protein
MTELLARQLGWNTRGIASATADPLEMAALIKTLATDRIAWEIAQETQLSLVAEDCDPAEFEAKILQIIGEIGKPSTEKSQASLHQKIGNLIYAS